MAKKKITKKKNTKKKNRNKKRDYRFELGLIVIFLLLCLLYVTKIDKNFISNFSKDFKEYSLDNTNNAPRVEINEEVVLKEYTGNKRDINSIGYNDYKTLGISKKKIDNIQEYKKYMGQINNVEDLSVLPRMTDDDMNKIRHTFSSPSKKKYKKHNINTASRKELKYMGFSNYEIKKIMAYRKRHKIKNIMDLESIVGDTYKGMSITF